MQVVLWFQEIVSTRTAQKDRHQLQAALNGVVEGEELVITALSRIGRTKREVINRLHDLQEKGIHVRTLDGLVTPRRWERRHPCSLIC